MCATAEEVATAGDDIDRLALRISLAHIDEQFEKILQKSLVFILRYLANYEDHRKKLMELLGDVTRRLKCRPSIQVPVHELFLSYNDPSNSVFLANFSHMYIKLGFPRLPLDQKIKLLPVLFASISEDKPICQRDALLHLTLPVIENISNELAARDLCFNELVYQRRYISDFFSLVMLLPYNFQRLVRFDGSDAVPPDGFNSYDLSRLLHERFSCITSADELEKYKVGIITFYTHHFFPAEESIIPVLFGNGDSRHSVVSIASKELRTLSMLVDWEDETLLNRILSWYLGRRREFDPKVSMPNTPHQVIMGRNEPRRPLSANMRIKLGHYLMRSRTTFPGTLASSLVEAAMLALESTYLQSNISTNTGQNAANFNQVSTTATPLDATQIPPGTTIEEGSSVGNTVVNVPRSSATSVIQQRRLAEHGLDLLAHLINNMTTLSGSASIAVLRCLISFVYERTTDELTYVRARGFEILSRFLARDPNYLLKDPAQLPRLFDVLSQDNPAELKLAAAHCLRRLAVTLHEAQKQNNPALRCQLVKLERLLYENIEKPDPLSRLVAVNFAGLIYPSDHIPTRYLILQALGDKDPRVRAEACMAFEQFLDPNIIHDIVYGRVKLPSFVEFVNHDTQHSRKNPFVEVERLIPVVQFIRLCLLATRGGLTPAQEAGLTYETEDEVRYLINQTVRYFLSVGNCGTNSQNSSGLNSAPVNSTTQNNAQVSTVSNLSAVNPEQAKRSIDTYFRLIQVVIFTRSQHTKDSPDFPNYLEEVLVGNTKELITCNKQLFDRMNSVLLATPRGATCRHACASVYSVVVMETETPVQALQTAKGMLDALPKPSTLIDGESSHAVQGMFMGAAYLLERLFTTNIIQSNSNPLSGKLCNVENSDNGNILSGNTNSNTSTVSTVTNSSVVNNITTNNTTSSTTTTMSSSNKKGKKEKQQKQLQSDILKAIEELLRLMDNFLVKPQYLFENMKSGNPKANSVDGICYVNSSVAQSTVTALLEALVVIARAGCLSHLPSGSLPISSENNLISLLSSKAALVHRIAAYLPNSSHSSTYNEENIVTFSKYQRVVQASLRALAALCMGENLPHTNPVSTKKTEQNRTGYHPHTIPILKLMVDAAEINDSSLHLAIGTALADCLLGPASPYRNHWYERSYPLAISVQSLDAAVAGQPGRWLAEQLNSLLTRRPGQVQTRPATVAAALWILNLVRRLGCLPKSLLSYQSIIDLLDEKDDSVQCVAVATLGLIYDRSSEEERIDLVTSLTEAVAGDDKKQGSPIYRELSNLARQIGRPDLALSLIVLAIALPPTSRFNNNNSSNNNNNNYQTGNSFSNVALNLASSVTYSSLVRRLGRSLAPALPRLVPRIFVRRFDYARPKLRQAMENVWLGLVLYATNSATPYISCTNSCNNINNLSISNQGSNQNTQQTSSNSPTPNSVHSLASEMVEAHFNAIVCEIKTQLGFNTLNTHSSASSQPISSSSTVTSPITTTNKHTITSSGTGTQNIRLRDACCLAIASLTTHPSADKRLAGHLPALLSGLLCLCDDSDLSGAETTSPAEEAAVAVQKLVIRVLENPCSREASTGLLPGLLPVIIDRAPWSLGSDNGAGKSCAQPVSESRRLTLELLLAAARTARPSALRPTLPQLILVGLHTMSCLHSSLVSNLMRQPIHQLHHIYSQTPNVCTIPANQQSTPNTVTSVCVPTSVSFAQSIPNQQSSLLPSNAFSNCKEVQMAEVLRLCVRLIDEICLSRLIVPFTELIRAGGNCSVSTVGSNNLSGSRTTGSSGSASIATATCVFLNHLAASNANALALSSKVSTCTRCSTSGVVNGGHMLLDNSNVSPVHKIYNSPSGSSQSSPSSLYGLSPSTPPGGIIHDVNIHSTNSATTDLPPSSNRCRAVAHSQKHNMNSSSANCSLTGTSNHSNMNYSGQTNASCCNNTIGGGFPSLAPHTGKLLAALLSALPGSCRHPNSAGKIVQVEMARALASLLRFAKDTTVTKLFNRVRAWYLQPEQATTGSDGGVSSDGGISISHWACARVLHAVAHQCPDLLYAHAEITLPLIFLNKQTESEALNLDNTKLTDPVLRTNLFLSDPNSLHGSFCGSLTIEIVPNSFIWDSGNDNAVTRPNVNDLEVYKQLWQESWEALISRIPSTTHSSQSSLLFWPNAMTLGFKSVIPLSNGLSTSFLRRPLLDHCTQLLHEALLDSSSWSVRSQASYAILQLAVRILSQPFSDSYSNQSVIRNQKTYQYRNYSKDLIPELNSETKLDQTIIWNRKNSELVRNQTISTTTTSTELDTEANSGMLEPQQQMLDVSHNQRLGEFSSVRGDEEVDGDDDDEEEEDDDEVGEEEDDDDDDETNENEESNVHAWLIMVQLTANALSKSKPWPGKAILLRAARMLAHHAYEQRDFVREEANQDIIDQMFIALARETRPRRAELIGWGYQAEAYLTLGLFAEATNGDAISYTIPVGADERANESTTKNEVTDRLTGIFLLLIPQWVKRDKYFSQAKILEGLKLNPNLNEAEQEIAARAIGSIWPLNNSTPYTHRFSETMAVLNVIMSQSGKNVQAACLTSVFIILAKLTLDQSAHMIEIVNKSGSKPFVELGLKELLNKIKRISENPKFSSLRENALTVLAGLIKHPSLIAVCRENIRQVLQIFSNDNVQVLRDWASELLKSV